MSRKQYGDLDFLSTTRITNLPAPAGDNDPARLADLNSAVQGLAWKDSTRVSTQGNLNLASPGATIDGITMASLDRVLVRSQSAAAENGIYIWNGAASATTRALDANTAAELEQAVTTVEEGTDAAVTYRQTAVNFTLDSGAVAWTAFGTATPAASETTAGKLELATQAETDTGTDDLRAVTPLKLATHSGRKRKHTANIGDGAATQYDLTHNFSTRDIQVTIYRNASPWDDVECDISRPDTNTARLNFTIAPTSNQFSVVILG